MILVTGAAGKTGRAVLKALLAKGRSVRALVYRPDQILEMNRLGAQDVRIGDMRNAHDMVHAFDHIQGVYHICPNASPDEVSIGQTVIVAAQSAGVEHFVFHSVLHPQIQAMTHHWNKLLVEELLIESGLPYTILQPAVYMQNMLASWEMICNHGIYPVPYPAETRLSYVELENVAEVAAMVMSEAKHINAVYELVGTAGLTQTELVAILSEQLNRPIAVKVINLPDWEKQSHDKGMGDYQIKTLSSMFRYYQQYGLTGNPKVLNWLLQRPPSSVADFANRNRCPQLQL